MVFAIKLLAFALKLSAFAILLRDVHKVRHARGVGVREGVTVCDREEGVQEHATSHF